MLQSEAYNLLETIKNILNNELTPLIPIDPNDSNVIAKIDSINTGIDSIDTIIQQIDFLALKGDKGDQGKSIFSGIKNPLSGQKYWSPFSNPAGGSFSITANYLTFVPLFVDDSFSIDSICMYLSSSSTSSFKAALYSCVNGLPDSLLVSSSEVLLSNVGLYLASVPSTLLESGIYYLAIHFKSTSGVALNANNPLVSLFWGIYGNELTQSSFMSGFPYSTFYQYSGGFPSVIDKTKLSFSSNLSISCSLAIKVL